MIFTDSELRYLATQRLGRIATQQPNGTLQVSPVGFQYNPATQTIDVYGFRMDASRKYRNVADNGRVAFVVDDLASTQPWRPRCVEIRGHAEATVGANASPMIRITPERIISFGLDESNDNAHEFHIDSRNVD
ncbi:PPOX class F420-dependent oxidoreductase [Planctomonas sp. JC2975]|uniref:PPOX class F420-dependent oxidoreductase n=1 Tax=Planctomonas sp. JC2975 TaxID=2729626 RepID=UPI001473BDAD|nr:PPOX class F420-dependent oxidoreductase [Planctomonas sp. JC2975]NNC13998.1 PPOX class F420-dependent oxidoreductase [Planctomonas sp. JC2975]